jgi:hypothetical protein
VGRKERESGLVAIRSSVLRLRSGSGKIENGIYG